MTRTPFHGRLDAALLASLAGGALLLHFVLPQRFTAETTALVLLALGAGRLAGWLYGRESRAQEAGRSAEETRAHEEALRLLGEKNSSLEQAKQCLESALYASMDPLVARLIIERKLHNEKRPLTVLFGDLENFTSSAEKTPPETVVAQLNQLFSVLEPVIGRYKGHIDKYMGDAVMAEFGAPYSAHNHSLLAVLAALGMQAKIKEGAFPWRMRIGVATGTLLVGLMGSERRKNYTAVGDTVNLASRLQTLCPPGGVCVDQGVYEAVKRWFHVRRIRVGLSPQEAKNLEAQLELLREAIEHAPTAKMCFEAANICSELGSMEKAMRYHKRAFELDPTQRKPIERAMAAALLTGEDRSYVAIKGKKERVAAYEVLGLRDVWSDRRRLPEKIMHVFRWLESELQLPHDWVLSIEAVEGRLGRAQAVAGLSGALAEAMGLGEEEVRTAFLAGYLCDVGKRNVPEHLLCYGGRISDLPNADQDLIRGHVEEAPKVLAEAGVPVSPELLKAVLQHHERFDGKGYPKGLKGEQICLAARIVRIADTYEAITTWRVYSDSLTPSAALVEMCRDIDSGAIDPKVGGRFLELMSLDKPGAS